MGAFSQITSGPSNSTGQNPSCTPNGLTLDSQNNIVASVGKSGTEAALQNALAVFQTATALTTITTAQTLLSQALNAWLLNRLNRTIKVTAYLVYTTAGTTTPTLTFALKLGTTTLATITTAATSATASTSLPVRLEFEFSTQAVGSAAAAIQCKAKVDANISANTAGAAVASYLDTNTAVVGSLNLETALTLALTIAASGTVTSAQLQWGKIEVVS